MIFFVIVNATACCFFLMYQTAMAGAMFKLIKVGRA